MFNARCFFIFVSCFALVCFGTTDAAPLARNETESAFVVRLDDRLNSILGLNATMETLASGFQWVEGPALFEHPAGHSFFVFSDVKKNVAYLWHNGNHARFLDPSGCHPNTPANAASLERCSQLIEPGSNGLLQYRSHDRDKGSIDYQYAVIACEHGNRRVAATVMTAESKHHQGAAGEALYVVLAESYGGKPFNSPNDIAQHPVTGDLFFTDPPYGLNGKENDKDYKQGFKGVYYIDRSYIEKRLSAAISGSTTGDRLQEPHIVTKEFTRPNGIAFSPDGQFLFVSNSDKTTPETRHIKVFSLDWSKRNTKAVGDTVDQYVYKLSEARIFARADDARKVLHPELHSASYNGNFDGIKVDANGNVFAAGPGGVHIYGSDGQHLGAILTGAKTGNIALGHDGFLYIAADTEVKRIALTSLTPSLAKQEL